MTATKSPFAALMAAVMVFALWAPTISPARLTSDAALALHTLA